MKLLSAIIFFALTTIALAQTAQIFYPPNGKRIHPGQHLTVQVLQANYIQSTAKIGIAIGIQSCAHNPCMAPSQTMATSLYHGSFNPRDHGPQTGSQPYQNITVKIPGTLPKGRAQLALAYAALWGGADFPSFLFDVRNLTVV